MIYNEEFFSEYSSEEIEEIRRQKMEMERKKEIMISLSSAEMEIYKNGHYEEYEKCGKDSLELLRKDTEDMVWAQHEHEEEMHNAVMAYQIYCYLKSKPIRTVRATKKAVNV